MTRTAIIAGTGPLPRILAQAVKEPLVLTLGQPPADLPAEEFRLERLVPLLDRLCAEGVAQVVFAGAVRRPRLDPELFDPRTATLVPRMLVAMQSGDDAALRELVAIFEEWGLPVVGVQDICPDLVPAEGVLAGAPTDADRRDAAGAAQIVSALGALDIGQGAVVAQGLCLAVETLPGTKAMLEFAALHADLRRDPKGARGVFYKSPKPGQDLRVDLPTLGPDSVAQAAAAGLAGIAWQAGGVIVVDRPATVAAAEAAGLFLWARS